MDKLEIGIEAPDFSLDDFRGRNISLSDFGGAKNVLLVFNRGFI